MGELEDIRDRHVRDSGVWVVQRYDDQRHKDRASLLILVDEQAREIQKLRNGLAFIAGRCNPSKGEDGGAAPAAYHEATRLLGGE
jgi:hypothetical protein